MTLIALTGGFRVVKATFDDVLRLTRGARNTVWPAPLSDGLITLDIIDEILYIDLPYWTPVRGGDRGCRQYTPSSNATTLESNKSESGLQPSAEACQSPLLVSELSERLGLSVGYSQPTMRTTDGNRSFFPQLWEDGMRCLQCQQENASDAKFCHQCAAPFASVCSACNHKNTADAKFCNQCGARITALASTSSSSPSTQQGTESESRFQALLPAVIGLLRGEGRVTYRTLKYVFGVDDRLLPEICEELLLRQIAIDEGGKVLLWTGEPSCTAHPMATVPSQPAAAEATAVSSPTLPPPAPLATPAATETHGSAATPEVSPSDVPPDEPVVVPEPARSAPEAERRQLTVMLCDLVGSTDLSGNLDPEHLREVVKAYQETAAEIIQRYEGHIAQYLGDGLLIYFGYPVAHEDDAQRAVHSGLGIVKEMGTLNTRLEADYGVQLAVRIGIHTGLVVVGEMGGGGRHENLALGETPNIAARLEGLAQANTAVLSPVTAQLVQRAFVLKELGSHELKGVPAPMMLYAVVRPRGVDPDDQESLRVGGFETLVGRDEEIGLLLRRWEQSKNGLGQVVMLSGEAGIGKSSLVDGLRDHVYQAGYTRIAYRCSPYHTHSAFYPIIEHVQRVLGWQPEDTADTQLRKLELALGGSSLPLEETVPLMASLLSLPLPEGRYPVLTLSPAQQRQQTQDVLVAWLLEEAERQAVLAVWEDLHWADPSTLEALGLLVEQVPTAPMLHVLTFRPEFEPPWPPRSHLTPLTLNRLERPQVEGLITRLAADKTLPAEVVEHIVAKTDGVPLYVEELTKMLLTSDLLQEETDQYVLTGPLMSVAIPDTLQDSLMARLDQMKTAKEVAQLGAVLGREFTYALIRGISSQDEETLHNGLAQLVEAELLYQRGRPPRAKYLFKHALIQDAAYTSLLRSQRQPVHQRIAHMLEDRFPDTAENQPELLAHHLTEGGLNEPAIRYWQQAGQRAIERSAHVEAIGHLRKGLVVLQDLPNSPTRAQHELILRLALGPPLIAIKGYGASEVQDEYTRTRELWQKVGDHAQLCPILYGLWTFYATRAEYETARALCGDLLHAAESAQDAASLLDAHVAFTCTSFLVGEFDLAREHGKRGLSLYDPLRHRSHALQNPGIVCGTIHAVALWYLGYPDQARRKSEETLNLTRELSHPFSSAVALTWLAMLHQCRRDAREARALAEEAMAISKEQNFPNWLWVAAMVRGWALVEQGQQEEGQNQVYECAALAEATGARIWGPYRLSLLAEAYARAGQTDAAQQRLCEALAVVHQCGERYWEAELHRFQGELLLSGSASDLTKAETCLKQAIEVAQRQQAKSLELRAAMRLTRLWQSQDRRQDAYALLAPVYEWFTEGFHTAELLDAKALLDDLSA